MYKEIKLTPAEQKEIKDQVARMKPEELRHALAELEQRFSDLMVEPTLVAQKIGLMKASCKHVNRELLPHAKLCKDCGEYFAVDTNFSPEVEAWFAEQHRIVMEQSPSVIMPPV